jgi:hypothetical protein
VDCRKRQNPRTSSLSAEAHIANWLSKQETASGFHWTPSMVIALQSRPRMAGPKRFVYVLNSTSHPTRYYTGITSNIRSRLAA